MPMGVAAVVRQIEKQMPLNQFLDELHIILQSGPTTTKIRREISAKLGMQAINIMLDSWYPGYSNFTVQERKKFAVETWPVIHLQHNPATKLYDPTHPLFKHFTSTNFMNFHGQKGSAKKRGIPFEFDFLGWLTWWISTGKFDQRGVFDHSYQMCRIGDTGSYHPDNVYCATGKQNRKDFHKNFVLEGGIGLGHKYIKRVNHVAELTEKLKIIEQQRQDLIRTELDKRQNTTI